MTSGKRFDRAWGIERDKNSHDYGLVVVGGEKTMPIILWRTPAGEHNSDNVTGALRHGDKVQVLARKEIDGIEHFKVKRDQLHKGKQYRQIGWLSARLLKKRGAKYYAG